MEKSKAKRDDMLTEVEHATLRILKRARSIKVAARQLDVSYRRVENILYNIRRKRVLCTNTVNRLNAITKNDDIMLRYLTPMRRWTPKIEHEGERVE